MYVTDPDDPDPPVVTMFMGAGTDDAPAMLADITGQLERRSEPVMLKMFFVEDADLSFQETCSGDNERVENIGNRTVTFTKNGTSLTVVETGPDLMMFGMGFDLVERVNMNTTLAFNVPSSTTVVTVNREEMNEILETQMFPISVDSQLRSASMDQALAGKGRTWSGGNTDNVAAPKDGVFSPWKSHRRRRSSWSTPRCSSDQKTKLIGGSVKIAAAGLCCMFNPLCCLVGAPSLGGLGTALVADGACGCAKKNAASEAGCQITR